MIIQKHDNRRQGKMAAAEINFFAQVFDSPLNRSHLPKAIIAPCKILIFSFICGRKSKMTC
jgi:hypothetical protein